MAESPVGSQLSPQDSPQQPLRNSTSLSKPQTIAQARAELEARLAGIHNDLQLTQNIGLLFVKREDDLKKCFEQLEQLKAQEAEQLQKDNDQEAEAEDGELPESFRNRLATLEKDFQDGENGILGLKRLIDAQLPVESSATNDLQTSRPGSILGASVLPSSTLPAQTITRPRRHKVVVPTTTSVDGAAFPLQIQEELLNQVRYWTSQAEMKEKLNQEYDTKINEQERIIDALNKQRRLREESEERQKEDQWNLELQNQELRNQITELQAQLSKATHEIGKLQKSLTSATEQAEQFKDKEEKTSKQLDVVKNKLEQDIATLRKHIAGVQREKAELVTKVEELNDTISVQQQKLSKKATLEAIAAAQELEDKEQENTAAPPVLIVSPPKVGGSEEVASVATVAAAAATPVTEPKVASLARETSFAHQQAIINDLQTKLNKEITEKKELFSTKEELQAEKEELQAEKEELVKMLADREETIETMRLEGVAAFEPDSVSKRSSLAILGGSGSKHPSDLGLPDEIETNDHHDLSMTMSENSSHEFSNGPSSPFPAGGLFAELAQATSQSNTKPHVECKDQEVMTEPIESWIHTVPGLSDILKEATSSQSKSEEASAVEATSEIPVIEALGIPEAATIRGKPGTETVSIEGLKAAEKDVDVIDNTTVGSQSELSVAIDDERRHTCDLSQSLSGATTTTAPPVPELSKELSEERPALGPEDRETRVSFGSAFGGDSNGTNTGRIHSIHVDNKKTDEASAQELADQPIDGLDVKSSNTASSAVAGVTAAAAAAATAAVISKTRTHGDSLSSDESTSSQVESRVQNGAEEKAEADNSIQGPSHQSSEQNGKGAEESHTSRPSTQPVGTIVSVSSRTDYTYQNPSQPNLNSAIHQHHHVITDATGTTIGRHPYRDSPNGSISSMSTDYNIGGHYGNDRTMSVGSSYDVTPTDPTMIQLITQTMIGDYLWKYTRRRMASMMSEKSHRRYVWVHPYTKTLYWSINNPAAEGSREQRAKSAFIMAVFQVTDESPNGHNSDFPNVSLIVQTTNRNIKLKAPTREKHELWFQSISYLLSRPTTPGADLASDNQTWSELQANNNRSASGASPSKTGNGLRNKSSIGRLQSMFGRNSISREGSLSSTSVGSRRAGQSKLPSGIMMTAAATVSNTSNGIENEKNGPTNSVVVATNGVQGS
ncbi:hypothetical protein BGZ46_009340 [Entomortierella lignicola]|nr:hypothetical protein BGZ46_009340 [Entomortierella lignicola]